METAGVSGSTGLGCSNGKPFEYRLLYGLLKPKNTNMHGCDIAGKVEEIGKNVKRFQIRDEVFGDLSEEGWAAIAEYTCVCENQLLLNLRV